MALTLLEPAEAADLRPHPHIGLATVTWLFEGGIVHRDSLGSVQSIRPGEVDWMVSRRGIAHSERAPDAALGGPARSHGLPTDHVERAVYLIDGALELDGQAVPANRLALIDTGDGGRPRATAATTLAVFGGDPLDGQRFVWWNFVASSRERTDDAKARWHEDRFPPIAGETERIPLPG